MQGRLTFQKIKIVIRSFLFLLLVCALLSCRPTVYYISRHAEKASTPPNDPPLTAEGEKQALALRDYLKGKKIGAVYSTNYLRTKATAKPTANEYGLPVTVYNVTAAAELVDSLKAGNKTNVLIVGHSNTVDDIVNRFVGTNAVTDLPDNEYGSLFIVEKKGNGYRYKKVSVATVELK